MIEPKDRLTFDGNFCDIAKCGYTRFGKYCPNCGAKMDGAE